MSYTVHYCEQRSAEWYALRCGRLTGSVADKMLATIAKGEAASRRDLRMRLVCERLTQQPQDQGDGYVSAEMQRGIDMEPAARRAYETITGEMVETSGFLASASVMAGCSLDGHISHRDVILGVVSLKCPKSFTHLSYVRGGVLPAAYVPQALHELWITGAEYYDFLSWDDRFPPALSTFYVRTQRDDEAVAAYAIKAHAFLAEVDREVAALTFPEQLAKAAGAA